MPATVPDVPLSTGAHNRWNTPRRMQAGIGAIWLCALFLFLAVTMSVRQHRAAIKAVGSDAAPSIIAAQHIRASLSDLDANAVNELVARPGQNMEAVKGYADRNKEIARYFVSACENITYGDAERVPLITLENGLNDYEAAVTQARDFHERGDAAMLAAYRRADDILHGTLFPAVDALDKANTDALNKAYAAQKAVSLSALALTVLMGLLLLAALAWLQMFLSRHMKRTFNPGLLAATLITLWFLLHTVSAFLSADHALKVAKEDAFDSVRALWQARAVAYDANADESRWLLDRPQASGYAHDFLDKSARIAQLPPGQTYGSVADMTAKEDAKPPAEFKGFLADELNNITFPGEREANDQTLRAWGVYIGIDAELRRRENAGSHESAVALCIGNDPGESNWAFDQFDNALGKTIDINQKEFDANIAGGNAALSGFDILCPVAMLLAAGLAFAGLLTRLREYAA